MAMARPAPTLMPGEAPQSDVHATFDRSGRAYLWGTCDGVVRVAAPRSRHLGLIDVAPGRALGFSFAIAGDGHGLASWIDSRCTTDAAAGSEPGPVRVRAFAAGAFGPPQTFMTGTTATQAIALTGTGSLVSGWAFSDQYLMSFDAQGVLQSSAVVSDGLPLAADAAGDLLVTRGGGSAVQPSGGGPEQPAPHGGVASVASNGRRFALAWDPDVTVGSDHRARSPRVRLRLSVWQP
jgi:hypothetical protein